MKTFSTFICLGFAVYVLSGCQQNTPVAESTVAIQPMNTSAESQPQEREEKSDKKSRADRFLNRAGDILKKATESTADGKGISKEWILDKIQEATDSGQNAIGDDAGEWARQMFDSLKDKGLTGANDATEWVTEDIRNMNAFKYKIVKVKLDNLEALEDQLNHFGQLKWDCFHVADRQGETILFFKKERRSLLKNVPVSDMMRLIPLMGNN